MEVTIVNGGSCWNCSWYKKSFKCKNMTKALAHLARQSGFDVKVCLGQIPPDWNTLYQSIWVSKLDKNDQKKWKQDILYSLVSSIQSEAASFFQKSRKTFTARTIESRWLVDPGLNAKLDMAFSLPPQYTIKDHCSECQHHFPL